MLSEAVDDSVKYVLDGARTWRFDLLDPRVDSDERSSVGTKLQYHVIDQLGLKKEPPLDTKILDVAVEIKGTTRKTWMIPREGQCEVTLLIRIDPKAHAFEAHLMRTHRAWLTGKKGNRDLKRTPRAEAVRRYSLPVVALTSLPPEPLRALSAEQLQLVFGRGGLRKRLVALFRALPETVIPRDTIAVVGAGLDDPMKRAREAKVELREKHGLIVLVGKWIEERLAAERIGFDIGEDAWIAVNIESFGANDVEVPSPR
ncbi:NaeI family type II restriction endonuclease [Arthrobacter woluwensis]|uniref:NaeI family type II restriction endonuclease n=1 Tax=Arthrobacter woluwensis TaxID=156980 RepID=UPI0015E6BEBA|nr:NaeI family type II restriction endonuclease [Arthrobacter woluwensis]